MGLLWVQLLDKKLRIPLDALVSVKSLVKVFVIIEHRELSSLKIVLHLRQVSYTLITDWLVLVALPRMHVVARGEDYFKFFEVLR